MAQSKCMPDPRFSPYSEAIDGELHVWGGKFEATTSVQVYESYLEVWKQVHTQGSSPPGCCLGASASSEHFLYVYGGEKDYQSYSGCLHRLDIETSCWTQLASHSVDSPMKKIGCRMIAYKNSLILIGGLGIRNVPIQSGSEWIKTNEQDDNEDPNTEVLTNEIHQYDVKVGKAKKLLCGVSFYCDCRILNLVTLLLQVSVK